MSPGKIAQTGTFANPSREERKAPSFFILMKGKSCSMLLNQVGDKMPRPACHASSTGELSRRDHAQTGGDSRSVRSPEGYRIMGCAVQKRSRGSVITKKVHHQGQYKEEDERGSVRNVKMCIGVQDQVLHSEVSECCVFPIMSAFTF